MPYKNAAVDKMRRAPLRTRNRAFVTEVNARTFCAHCGKQPIEWHNPEHMLPGRKPYRLSQMVWRCRSIAAIQTELDRCTPLCRRCHMIEDGRLAQFVQAGVPQRGGRQRSTAPCSECGRAYWPLRRGLCSRCSDRKRPQRRVADRQQRPEGGEAGR